MENKAEYITDASELMGWNAPKQIITEISGFYPIFESVLKDTKDVITAAVHGVMWRYCQMEDRVCKVPLDKIANILGVSTATIMRRQEKLVELGYFTDRTPDLRNKPHVFVDNQKVVMRNQLTASHFTEKRDVSERNVHVSESQLNKDSNKESNKDLSKRKAEAKERIAKQRAEREARDPVLETVKASQDFAPVMEMRHRIEAALHMNLEREWDLPKSDWNGYEKQLLERERETGQTIERFMDWFNADEFQRKSSIWLKPSKIEQLWPRAFETPDPEENPYPLVRASDDDDSKYAPMPDDIRQRLRKLTSRSRAVPEETG